MLREEAGKIWMAWASGGQNTSRRNLTNAASWRTAQKTPDANAPQKKTTVLVALHRPTLGKMDNLCSMGQSAPATVYLGLGSNLDNPPTQVRAAISLLDADPHIQVIQSSLLQHQTRRPSGSAGFLQCGDQNSDHPTRPSNCWTASSNLEQRQGRVKTLGRKGH